MMSISRAGESSKKPVPAGTFGRDGDDGAQDRGARRPCQATTCFSWSGSPIVTVVPLPGSLATSTKPRDWVTNP